MASCHEITPAYLTGVCDKLSKLTGAAVYVAQRLGKTAGPDDEPAEAGAAPAATVKFLAASAKSLCVLGARQLPGEGMTWGCWEAPPAPEAAEEVESEEGAPPPPPPAPPAYPTVHVPNVLKHKAAVFHDVPRPAAFYVVPVVYESPLHPDCVSAVGEGGIEDGGVEEGLGGGEGEGAGASEKVDADGGGVIASMGEFTDALTPAAKSPAPQGPPKPLNVTRFLAICADTVGLDRDFAPAEKALLVDTAGVLAAALARTELAFYNAEYAAGSLKLRRAEEEAKETAIVKTMLEEAAKSECEGEARAEIDPSVARGTSLVA